MKDLRVAIPETLSAVEFASKRAASAPPLGKESDDATHAILSGSARRSGPTGEPDAPSDGQCFTLPVLAISCYDQNPRQTVNTKFREIKESLKVKRRPGFRLTVTRRPGDSAYMIAAGGNTRLAVLHELFRETGDPAFAVVDVQYVAWESEAATLMEHFLENETRADLTFWEKANGIVKLKTEIELSVGKHLSNNEFEGIMRGRGLSIGAAAIASYRFAIEKLAPIGPRLNADTVRALKPHINAFRIVWQSFQQIPSVLDDIVLDVLEKYDSGLTAEAPVEVNSVVSLLEESLCLHLHVPRSSLRERVRDAKAGKKIVDQAPPLQARVDSPGDTADGASANQNVLLSTGIANSPAKENFVLKGDGETPSHNQFLILEKVGHVLERVKADLNHTPSARESTNNSGTFGRDESRPVTRVLQDIFFSALLRCVATSQINDPENSHKFERLLTLTQQSDDESRSYALSQALNDRSFLKFLIDSVEPNPALTSSEQ